MESVPGWGSARGLRASSFLAASPSHFFGGRGGIARSPDMGSMARRCGTALPVTVFPRALLLPVARVPLAAGFAAADFFGGFDVKFKFLQTFERQAGSLRPIACAQSVP